MKKKERLAKGELLKCLVLRSRRDKIQLFFAVLLIMSLSLRLITVSSSFLVGLVLNRRNDDFPEYNRDNVSFSLFFFAFLRQRKFSTRIYHLATSTNFSTRFLIRRKNKSAHLLCASFLFSLLPSFSSLAFFIAYSKFSESSFFLPFFLTHFPWFSCNAKKSEYRVISKIYAMDTQWIRNVVGKLYTDCKLLLSYLLFGLYA